MSASSQLYLERLHEQVEAIGDYLAELKYIDDAVAYLDALPPGMPAGGSYEVSLGTSYPFTVSLQLSGPSVEEVITSIENDLGTLAEQANQFAFGSKMTLLRRVRDIVDRDGRQYESVDGRLDAIAAELGTVPADLGLLGNSLSDWKGDDAQAFANFFYQPFQHVVNNQSWLVAMLRDGVRACQGVVNLAQHSLMSVVTATRESLVEQLRDRREQHRPWRMSERHALIIASVATGLLAAATVKIPPLSITLATTSVGLGYAATNIPPEDGEEVVIVGQSAPELSNAMHDAVGEIIAHAQSTYDALEGEMQKVAAWVEDRQNDQRHPLFPPRPSLGNPDEFYHRSSSRYDD